MLPEVVQKALPYIVLVNFAIVCGAIVLVLSRIGRRTMDEVPIGIQNTAEYFLDWFVKQSRGIDPGVVDLVVPFIATLFMVIFVSNLLAIVPLPLLSIPPTAFFGVTFALALTAVLGSAVLNGIHRGLLPALTHLFWPNPIQLIFEVSDVASLSLRLFGNIAGEFLVALLVLQSAPYGIPIIIHALGLIPAFIQPLVFTLLTTSFLANAMTHREKPKQGSKTAKRWFHFSLGRRGRKPVQAPELVTGGEPR